MKRIGTVRNFVARLDWGLSSCCPAQTKPCYARPAKASLVVLFFLSFVAALEADPQIAAAQKSLEAQGLYDGSISGEIDNETAAAITRFQLRRGLEVTGELNEETFRALGINPSMEGDTGGQMKSKAEPWRALRQQDREFLERLTAEQPRPVGQPAVTASSMDEIRDFVAGFVVVGINPDVDAELQFYAPKADYYDRGVVTKDFIKKDIRRYNQKWPIRRYWLVGDVQVLSGLEANPVEVRYQIKYSVENRQKRSSGTAVKTLKLQKSPSGLEIVSVREKTLD